MSTWVDAPEPPAGSRQQTPFVVESRTMILDEEQMVGFSAATVLRAFDGLRRRISVRVTGTEGVFAGYDHVDLLCGHPPSCRLCLVGQLLGIDAPNHHRVRYLAYSVLDRTSAGAREVDVLLAHAVGTTISTPEEARNQPWDA